ncbi:MAG: MAPEG family protein [Deltaproteobacteria bacterium]|nr:MAPEG family protein [Deltaproteobacteria bacterium]
MDAPPIVAPVIALTAWTHLVLLWMYATRIPAVLKAGMEMDRNRPRGQQMAELPARVRWKSDNYSHLTEHPTVFYATALAVAFVGPDDTIALWLAWAYVGLRVVHTLIQAIYNDIMHRFAAFGLSAMVGIALTVRAIQALL